MGSSLATYSLGRCHMNGNGVEQDIGRALEHFQRAAELGYVQAFADIGDVVQAFADIGDIRLQKGEQDYLHP